MRGAWRFTGVEMNKMRVSVLAIFAFLAACTASLPPAETTPDGLVRVPSRAEGGVYRKPNADFTRYKRMTIEPPTVEFIKGWRKNHPNVSKVEVRRIEAETAKSFREAFTGILVGEGLFALTDVREADVLVVVPRITDLNIPSPETEFDAGFRSYSPYLVSMEVSGELRDGINGEVLLRVNMIDPEDRLKLNQNISANRITNAREIHDSMERWSRLVREAIDVAKASKPR
jgi:hypothetical protein